MELSSSMQWYAAAFVVVIACSIILVIYHIRRKSMSLQKKEDTDSDTKNKNIPTEKDDVKPFNFNTGGAIFLPPSLQGPAAMLRLGTGGCYHKQA
jgi:hypothetical protein